jgi:hypothetical protein
VLRQSVVSLPTGTVTFLFTYIEAPPRSSGASATIVTLKSEEPGSPPPNVALKIAARFSREEAAHGWPQRFAS